MLNKNLFVGSYSGYNITGQKNIVLGNYETNSSDVTGVTNIKVDNNIFLISTIVATIIICYIVVTVHDAIHYPSQHPIIQNQK